MAAVRFRLAMQKKFYSAHWIGLAIFFLLLSGCAVRQAEFQPGEDFPTSEAPPAPPPSEPPPRSTSSKPQRSTSSKPPRPAKKTPKDSPLVRRVVSEKELRGLERKDPDLHFQRCLEILAKINGKDREYIRYDIKKKRPLSVPRDFAQYKNWSPLPLALSGVDHFPKFILIVKDLCFLGWYERGRMTGDTYVCIGKMNTWTKRGVYRIDDKDIQHMSTYPNAYGNPSLMPFALHIYDRVWIHAGDVVGRNFSHGCINVPLFTAEKLYSWAEIGTPVLVTESLRDLGKDVQASFPQKQKPKAGGPPAKLDAQNGSLKTLF